MRSTQEVRTPIATEMYLPNHSGIASHPEAKKTFVEVAGDVMTGDLTVPNVTILSDLTVDTDTLFVDSANDNVGIGTNNPGISTFAGRTYLTIKGISDQGVLEIATGGNNTNGAALGQIQWTDEDSTHTEKRIGLIASTFSGSTTNQMGGVLRFFTKADGAVGIAEAMRIDRDGNIGIGTTSPDSLLEINGTTHSVGDVQFDGNLIVDGTGALGPTTISGQFQVNDTTFPVAKFTRIDREQDTIWGTFSGKAIKTTNMGDGFGSAFICFIEDNAAVENAVGFFGAVRDGADNTGKVILSAYNLGSFSTSDFVLDKDGNLGIGTADPASKIDVLSTGNLISNFESTLTDYARIVVNGGVGADTQISFQNAGSTKWSMGNDADTDALTIRTGVGAFGTNDKLILLSTGEVGIGTVSPVTNLDVNGGIALGLVSKTTTYTATVSDHVVLGDATSGAFTVTLPAASTASGLILHVKKVDSSGNAVTVDGNSAETIDGATTRVLSTQYESVMIVCDGSNWHVI